MWRAYVVVYIKGMLMGAADVVPGVSGGTIALITGIYPRLIGALGQFGPQLYTISRQQGWRAVWQKVDATFLLAVFAGIATSVVSFAGLLRYLLQHQPVLINAFFFGLVVASVVVLLAEVQQWRILSVFLFVCGATGAWTVATLPYLQGTHGPWFMFFAGALAICAMILPGISGAFILLLLGVYGRVLDALHQFDLPLLIVFGAGALCGLLSFTHVLKWLFAHYYAAMLAMLTGIVAGSLYKLWPWQIPQHVLPWSVSGTPVWAALLCMIVGATLVLGIHRLGMRVHRVR